jgi:hypothetical protein
MLEKFLKSAIFYQLEIYVGLKSYRGAFPVQWFSSLTPNSRETIK